MSFLTQMPWPCARSRSPSFWPRAWENARCRCLRIFLRGHGGCFCQDELTGSRSRGRALGFLLCLGRLCLRARHRSDRMNRETKQARWDLKVTTKIQRRLRARAGSRLARGLDRSIHTHIEGPRIFPVDSRRNMVLKFLQAPGFTPRDARR